ncbi:hypothetical protein HNQ79_003738 [Streptomyces candidus]|uniref:Uncharacterized protein n=1 Tax=Streptomyces candidus TaxID=67283 RepID=A0A7X0HGK9_9ACTN|nr:hypothetical protein [Streptomyces candidus]
MNAFTFTSIMSHVFSGSSRGVPLETADAPTGRIRAHRGTGSHSRTHSTTGDNEERFTGGAAAQPGRQKH